MQSAWGVVVCTMNNTEILELVCHKVADTLEILRRKTQIDIPSPMVDIKRLGTTEGRAHADLKLEINPDYFSKYKEEMIRQIIPHEVCHNAAYHIYTRLQRVRIKGHGREWANLMRMVGLQPDRCHNFDVSEAKLRQTKKYTTICDGCGAKYNIGAARYNKMGEAARKYNGNLYRCSRCKTSLPYNKWYLVEPAKQNIAQVAKQSDLSIPEDLDFSGF